jgi:hypothetical protein
MRRTRGPIAVDATGAGAASPPPSQSFATTRGRKPRVQRPLAGPTHADETQKEHGTWMS